MAQPGVAREPSMEEILASIRRIIESNEPAGAPGLPQSLPPVYAEEEIEDDFDAELPIAANGGVVSGSYGGGQPSGRFDRTPEPVSPPARVPAPANQSIDNNAERPMSLADVAARVRAASVRTVEAADEGVGASGYGALRNDNSVIRENASFAASSADESVASMVSGQQAAAKTENPLVTSRMAELRGTELRGAMASLQAYPELLGQNTAIRDNVNALASVDVPVRSADSSAVADVAPDISSAGQLNAVNLLSSEAGQQVARSFGELADVFNGVERRSMEEMAVEILQPMLKEWLDDNLPTLVERLVREEIERVARSPRR